MRGDDLSSTIPWRAERYAEHAADFPYIPRVAAGFWPGGCFDDDLDEHGMEYLIPTKRASVPL